MTKKGKSVRQFPNKISLFIILGVIQHHLTYPNIYSINRFPLSNEVIYFHLGYGLGTLCVVFLSLASVLGAIFIKITGTKKKAFLLSLLLAVSVGCLLGDAILHLVPSVS